MRRILAVWLPVVLAAGVASAQSNDFQWSGSIPAGKTIEIKGVNGQIRAELATGNQVEVVATKRTVSWDFGRHHEPSDPALVKVEVVQNDGDVTICAVYPTPSRSGSSGRRGYDDGPNECRPGSQGRMNVTDNDVAVDFVVKVPAGVHLAAKTVNGEIDARALKSNADVQTVNGRIFVATTGVANAKTVNGSIEASTGPDSGTEPLNLQTVNGSVTLRMPKGTNAELEARTSNGHFESDFPITIQHFSGRQRHVNGTIGSGGRRITLKTVNGSIRLKTG